MILAERGSEQGRHMHKCEMPNAVIFGGGGTMKRFLLFNHENAFSIMPCMSFLI